MTFRRFEMHHYRHLLSCMRLGQTDRAIARAGIMGRHKIAQFRQVALKQGWPDPALPLPEDAELSGHVQARKEDHLLPSLVEPYSDEVISWIKDGVQGTTIHSTLVRKYGFQGSYSSVRRFLAQFKAEHPQLTIPKSPRRRSSHRRFSSSLTPVTGSTRSPF